MKWLRFVVAPLLVVLAVVAVLLAADVRAWQRVLAHDVNGATAAQRLPWSPAARLLSVRDDVRARRAVAGSR